MSLREDLIEALRKSYEEPTTKGPDDIFPQMPGWPAVADECIRQMAWARRNVPYPDELVHEWATDEPLTLAPEDWKP